MHKKLPLRSLFIGILIAVSLGILINERTIELVKNLTFIQVLFLGVLTIIIRLIISFIFRFRKKENIGITDSLYLSFNKLGGVNSFFAALGGFYFIKELMLLTYTHSGVLGAKFAVAFTMILIEMFRFTLKTREMKE